MAFDARRDRARIAAYSRAAYGRLISPHPPISPGNLYPDAGFMRCYAVDYIDACAKENAICRFFRALSPQLWYSSFALNTSVVLCGLW